MELGFRIHYADRVIYVSQDSLCALREGNTTVYRTQVEGAQAEWRFEPYLRGMLIDFKITSSKPLGIKRIDSIALHTDNVQKTDRIVFLGRKFVASETRYPSELGEGVEYTINCIGTAADFTQKGMFFSALTPYTNVYGSVACKKSDNEFDFYAKTEFTDGMSKECELCAERIFLCEDIVLSDFFDDYRTLIPVSSFDMPKLTGWNSWDYYCADISPEDIYENINVLGKMPFADQMKYIVIDDGWQKSWGEWVENEKFSCGLGEVADKIKAAGFIPGIWMAPVSIGENSEILTTHPEWLCKNESGQPLFSMDLYYLDPTHPEVEKMVLDNYRYQYDCGYRLFKMDFVSPLLDVKRFYDDSATPYDVLSELVRKVKECTGPDAVVLGCSLPLECGADIAPAMRIGVDIHNHFGHVLWIAEALSWSWMFNRRNTRIDTDFMVVRGEDTSTEPVIWFDGKRNNFVPPRKHLQTDSDRQKSRWRHGEQFNFAEAETWANLSAISGGNIFLSDRMSKLNQKGIDIISNALTLAGDEVRPVYQKDDRRLASLWLGDKAFLIINWEDVPRNVTISGVDRTFRSDKPYSYENGKVTVSLLAHESFAAIFED